MTNIRILETTDSLTGKVTEHIIIEKEDGGHISMLKSTWDEMQAEKSE